MKDNPLTTRTLKASFLLAPIVVILFCTFGYKSCAIGFILGASLSLFSFITLKIVVPKLFMPGSPRYVKGILSLALWLKMPLICVVLYVGTHSSAVSPAAMVPGIGFMPAVIVLCAIGNILSESRKYRHAAAMLRKASSDLNTHPLRPARTARVSEPLREGV